MKIPFEKTPATLLAAICIIFACPRSFGQGPSTQESESRSLFKDPEDGAFDVSGFLSTRTGFLPIAIPITEPAVGLGLGVGLTFFHGKPQAVQGDSGQPRVIMPSTSVVFGVATENGTWGTGLGHLGIWQKGHIRYLGAAGYASLNLDWYGTDDALNGRAISYTNDVLFLFQRLTFQIGDSDFFIGPQYRLFSSDSTFGFTTLNANIPEFELQSTTAGLGIDLSYDSLDQPYSPTKGIRAGVIYSQQAEWLGGDFNYGKLEAYGIMYTPITPSVIFAVHLHGKSNFGDAPFYDLPSLTMRGIPAVRYVDDTSAQIEAELRWDFTQRWTALVFGGIGRVAPSISDLGDADNRPAAGTGIRYLIAREYGLRMGMDVAYGDGDWTVYIGVGTGWLRP